MRYRNIVLNKTEVLEAKLKQLENAVNHRQPVREFLQVIEDAKEIIGEIQSYVDREERSAGEINKTR
jgi:hypothetical protein